MNYRLSIGFISILSLAAWAAGFTGYPRGTQTTRRPTIGADMGERVRPESVRLMVDNKDITYLARVNDRKVSWQPDYDIDAGRHNVTVSATTRNGQNLQGNWAFTVDPPGDNDSANNIPYLSLRRRTPEGDRTDSRPSIGASFDGQIRGVTLTIDGHNFTDQARITGNEVSWKPTYDLDPGRHMVTVNAVGTHGRRVIQSWSFNVQGNNGGNNNWGNGNLQINNLLPQANSTTGRRPTLGAGFNENLSDVRLYADGRDLTSSAQRLYNSIQWTPNYDLDQGNHQVRVYARGLSGRTITREWNFRVGRGGGSTNSLWPSTNNLGMGNVSQLTPFPASGTTNGRRFPIGCAFPNGFMPQRYQLEVDSQDVTSYCQSGGNSIYFQPNYDVQPGQHHAHFTGTANGQRIEQNWTFYVQ